MEQFKEVLELRDAYQEKLKECTAEKFKEWFAGYFERHPMVEQVYWDQYTPYFNDGEPCVFHVNGGNLLVTKEFAVTHPKIVVNYNEKEEGDNDNGHMDVIRRYPEGPRWFDTWLCERDEDPKDGLTAALRELKKILDLEDVLQAGFGEDVGVLVSRMPEGVCLETGEVDHD